VVGLAGLGGHVYGQDSDDATSDITVNAEEVQIEITLLEQDGEDLTNENPVDPSGADIDIEVTVTVDEEADQDEIDSLLADFYYDGDKTEHGDAVTGEPEGEYELYGEPEENGDTFGDWTLEEEFGEGSGETTNAEALYSGSLEIDNMMRYGDWEVFGEVVVTGDEYETYEQFDVSTFVSIGVDSDNNQISGTAAPGQTLVMSEDVNAGEPGYRTWTSTDTIEEFRINSNYELSGEADGPDDDDEKWFVDMEIDYGEYEFGTPISYETDDDNDIGPDYTLDVPIGIESGTYTGDMTHTLSNIEEDENTHTVTEGDSIQDAIDDADEGDTILLEGGMYTEEDIRLNTDDITITSLDSDNPATIENSEGESDIFKVDNDGINLSYLEIQSSDGQGAIDDSGGMAFTLRNSEVKYEDDDTDSPTSIVNIAQPDLNIIDSTIEKQLNLQSGAVNARLVNSQFDNINMGGENAVIRNNDFTLDERGQAITMTGEGGHLVEGNTFSGEQTGITLASADNVIQDNTFENIDGTVTSSIGGEELKNTGIIIFSDAENEIEDNTFDGNDYHVKSWVSEENVGPEPILDDNTYEETAEILTDEDVPEALHEDTEWVILPHKN